MSVKKATHWLRYDHREKRYIDHHIVMGHLDKGVVRPHSDDEKMMTLWGSMQWKKVYGYFNTETKTFIPSKRKNI